MKATSTYVETKTHGGCILLLRHLKLVTWFGHTDASVHSALGWTLQWLALVRTCLWWLWLTMLAEFVYEIIINGIVVVQTNQTLHTLKPRSSHVEIDIWGTHTHTKTDGQRFLAFIERYFSLKEGLWSSVLNELFKCSIKSVKERPTSWFNSLFRENQLT